MANQLESEDRKPKRKAAQGETPNIQENTDQGMSMGKRPQSEGSIIQKNQRSIPIAHIAGNSTHYSHQPDQEKPIIHRTLRRILQKVLLQQQNNECQLGHCSGPTYQIIKAKPKRIKLLTSNLAVSQNNTQEYLQEHKTNQSNKLKSTMSGI